MIYILIILHLLIIFYEWSKQSLSVILWAVLFIVFTMPHMIHCHAHTFSDGTLMMASTIAIIFMVLYITVRFLYFRKNKNKILQLDLKTVQHIDTSLLNLFYFVYFCSFIVSIIFFYIHGGSLLTVKWTFGTHRSMLERLANMILIAFSGLGFIAFSRKEYIRFFLLLCIYIINLLITQSRYNIVGFIAPFMVYYLFHKSIARRLQGVGIGIGIILFVYFLQQYRWLGGLNHAMEIGILPILKSTVDYMKAGNGEFGLIKAFYYFIENDNRFMDFGEGKGYVRLALLFLPASIFSFKPRDFAIDMYREWFKVDNPMGTMHPTLFGDVYANFGPLGSFMGIFYGLFTSFFDEVILRTKDLTSKVLLTSLICTMYVLIGRGAVYNATFNCIAGMILIIGVNIVYRFSRMVKKRGGESDL